MLGKSYPNTGQLNIAVEAAIHIGLTILLAISCLLILRPFIPLLAWGIIIAVSAYPAFQKLQSTLGGRRILAAVLFALLFLVLLIIPIVLLGEAVIDGAQTLSTRIKNGSMVIPPPPATVQTWPIIGRELNRLWTQASTDISSVIMNYSPQIKAAAPGVISVSAGIGLTMVQFVLSILVAGALLANSQGAYQVIRALCIASVFSMNEGRRYRN